MLRKKLILKKFIKEIDKDIKVKFQKWDLQCDVYNEIVYIGKPYDKKTLPMFNNFVKELNPDCNYNPLLMAILHEIGHIMTWDDEENDNKNMIFALLKYQLKENKISVDEANNLYFRIPCEQNATQWGIDFAMAHPQLMSKYNKLIDF